MDATETEVARILLELPQLMCESEFFGRRFSFRWGVKRRRSSSSSQVDTQTTLTPDRMASLPPPPSVPEPSSAPVGPSPAFETEKSKALSPSTPLLFSPSESDGKSKHSSRKVYLKRKRDESLQMIDKLTESNQFFQEKIKNIQDHYDQITALNLQLKARKQMIMSLGLQKETHPVQLSSSNLAMEIVPQPTTSIQFDVQHHRRHQSLYTIQHPLIIMDHRHQTAHSNAETLHPYDGQSPVSFMVNDNVGPLGIPDLNVSLEESFELESEQQLQKNHPAMAAADQIGIKSLAAQARQRRIQICRSKNLNAASSKRWFPVYR